MSFIPIPNFNDPYAKVQEREHTLSGAKIIDILYGAQDKNGNPTSPEKNSSDGHGHFIAIEIDGLYQVLSWRHSRSEGGGMDEGSSRIDNPLHDLEEEIKEKRAVLRQAQEAMKTRNYDIASVDSLLTRFNTIFDYNTPVERELKEKHNRLVSKNEENKRYRAEQRNNAEKKKALIAQAQSFQYSEDWKRTSDEMKSLMDRWKQIGNAGESNHQLWSDFQNVRQVFYDRRSKHYDEQDKQRIRHKHAKEQLISEARSVSQYSTDWNGTHQRLEEIFSRWKQIGSAGRDSDDRLWAEFQSIRDDFYARKSAARKEQENEFANRRQAKSALIQEAQAYASKCDYSPSISDRMRELNSEWKSIGFCGKDYEDSLWSLFRQAQDSFWLGKKQAGAERHQEWLRKTQDAIDRRRDRIYKIQQNIDNLRDRLYTTRNYEKQMQIEGWISENEAQIREIENEIYRMESEMQ